jgi:hypothetical protein
VKSILKNLPMMLLVVLAGCGDDGPTTAQTTETKAVTEVVTDKVLPGKPTAIFLRYDVLEPGVEPYQTEMVITDEYLRIDDDDNPRNFILVDRKQNIVYSVSDDNDAILVIAREPVELDQAFEIKYTEQRISDEQAPSIDGKQTSRYIFEANGVACYDTVVAEGLLPGATKALTQYLSILAGQHASTLKQVPADVINACDLGMHVLNPGMHLVHGLPISEHDPASGYRRQLIEFDDAYEVDAALFVLPGDFGRFSISDLKSGKMPAQESGE